MTQQIIIIAHIIVSVLMVGIILLQQGKGAEAGASFGSGGSQTVLGATGSASLLARLTSFLTVLFFGLSFALAYYANFAAREAGKIEITVPEAQVQQTTQPAQEIPVLESQPAAESDVPVINQNQPESNQELPVVP